MPLENLHYSALSSLLPTLDLYGRGSNTPTVSRDKTNTKLLRDLCVALGCLHSGGFVARINQPDPGGFAAH